MPRKNPKRNISRVESYGENGTVYGGWSVRMQRRGEKLQKYFSDSQYGGKRGALQEAKTFRDAIELQEPKYTTIERSERPSKRNRSGIVGVRLHKQKDSRGTYEYHYWYWVAQWTDGKGKRRTKSFSIHQHGDNEAYRLACKARQNGIKKAQR